MRMYENINKQNTFPTMSYTGESTASIYDGVVCMFDGWEEKGAM